MQGIEICAKTEKHPVLVSLNIISLNRTERKFYRHVLQPKTAKDEEKK